MKPGHYDLSTSLADVAEFEQAATIAIEKLRSHVEHSAQEQTPATGWAPVSDVIDQLLLKHWIDHGGMGTGEFSAFLDDYLTYSVQFRHPGYIAHQVSVPDYPAALGALINGVTNNPMGIYEMGAAAAAIEFEIINWMLRKVGWPQQKLGVSEGTAGGVTTHGGSLANLTALLAARARIAPDAWDKGNPQDLAVLVPRTSHYSNGRAVSMLGLGQSAIYPLDVDDFGVINVDALEQGLARVKADNRRAMALVANACSTATGLHDALRPIGEFCNHHNIWFHADACHGATALLCPDLRYHLDGIELADSVAWDTHKMMQVPVLSAAVLFKDVEDFSRAFQLDASYLAFGQSAEHYDSIQRTIECTRSAMAFKIFLNLAWRGEAALGDYVQQQYAKAQEFYEQISNTPGFECPYKPETNILCFRYGANDDEQERIRTKLMQSGQFHITSAVVNSCRYLRLTVMNRLTNRDTIDALLKAIIAA